MDAEWLFTAPDTLTYHIGTPDIYQDILENMAERYDTCDYQSSHPYHSK